MDYESYLKSADWAAIRAIVLDRDLHKCQTCLSDESLEVHHKTYVRLGNEALEDLITLCHDCHEAITAVIRRRRYKKKSFEVTQVQRHLIISEAEDHGKKIIEVQTYVRSTPAVAQRANGRSFEQVCEVLEASEQQARQGT